MVNHPKGAAATRKEEQARLQPEQLETAAAKMYGGTKVNNQSFDNPEFFDSDAESNNSNSNNNILWQYVQSLSPETVAHLSKPTSAEVFQVMEHNIVGLLGHLPSEHFGVTVSTNRENLGRLLASAMMSGYFLRNAEQRLTFEKSLQMAPTNNHENE